MSEVIESINESIKKVNDKNTQVFIRWVYSLSKNQIADLYIETIIGIDNAINKNKRDIQKP